MADSALIESARQWVIASYPYNRTHLLRALEWLDRLAPAAREAARLAALTHDMERAFPGPDSPVMVSLVDPEYERLHSERSARIVAEWLHARGAGDRLITDVEQLILAHETGGWPEADLVQAADSLSFLHTNVDLFLGFVRSGRYPVTDVRAKFEHSYHRIQLPHARRLALPLLDEAISRLSGLEGVRSSASA
jgi:hypothetical protein